MKEYEGEIHTFDSGHRAQYRKVGKQEFIVIHTDWDTILVPMWVIELAEEDRNACESLERRSRIDAIHIDVC